MIAGEETSSKSKRMVWDETRMAKRVYLYMYHSMGSMAHTLFAIPVPKYEEEESKFIKEKENIEPIIEFPASEYPKMMGCIKIGWKFYFVGGERWRWGEYGYEDDKDDIYSRDVYVFDERDESSSRKVVKLEVGMKTGKPCPVCFVADEKLFVLGSCGGPKLISFTRVNPTKFDASSFRFFEVYDPATKEWSVLSDPPVSVPTVWLPSSVMVLDRKVYVHGEVLGNGSTSTSTSTSTFLFSFDLDSYCWTGPLEDVNYDGLHFRPSGQLIGDTIYGLPDWGGGGVLRRMLKPNLQSDAKFLFRCLNHHPLEHGGLRVSCRFCHIGARNFCYVTTSSPPDSLLPFYYGVHDQCRRYFVLHFFRELTDNNNKEEEDSPVRSHVWHSAIHLFKSKYSTFGSIRGCFPSNHTVDFDGGAPGVETGPV